MIANILIYEDNKYSNFVPLAYLRPVYDLISGMSTLLSKITRVFPNANISLHCRDNLKNIVKQNHPGIAVNNINTGLGCLIINGRVLAEADFDKKLKLDGRERLFIDDYEEVVALYLESENLHLLKDKINHVITSKELISTYRNKTEVTHVDCKLIEYPWELVNDNIEQLKADFKEVIPNGLIKGQIHPQTSVIDEFKIYVGKDSSVYPNVTLNAEKGPIFIGDNCTVKPSSYIEGPVYIGNNTNIISATLLPGTSIGPRSNVSGTVRNSIFHGYSDVQNANIKDSYCSEVVEIGEETTNSSINSPFKNEGDIYIDGYEIKTDEKKLGSYIADYATIGQKCTLKSGSVIGIASQFHDSHLTLPKYTPSFIKLNGHGDFYEVSVEKSLEYIEYLLGSKYIELTAVEKSLIENVYDKSADRKKSKIMD